MECEYILGPNGELYHSGIKGMKWGVRRYQNKDGSLTPAGRKRYNKEVAKLKEREKQIKGQERAKARQAKLDAKKSELELREKALKDNAGDVKKSVGVKSSSAPTKKSVRDMSDEELRSETSRMMAEAQYLNAQRQLAAMTPQKVSMGKKYVDGFVNAAVPKLTNAAADMATKYVTKKVSDALGLNEKKVESIYEKAKNEAEYWKNLNTAEQQKKQYERGKQTERDEATAKKKSAEEAKAKDKAEKESKAAKEEENRQREKKNKKAAKDYVKNVVEEQDELLREIDTNGWKQYDEWLRKNGYEFID